MNLYNDPIVPGQPVTFKLQGFPEESALRFALERVYRGEAAADRNFVVNNMFDEKIFEGSVDSEGRVAILTSLDRRDKPFEKPKVD